MYTISRNVFNTQRSIDLSTVKVSDNSETLLIGLTSPNATIRKFAFRRGLKINPDFFHKFAPAQKTPSALGFTMFQQHVDSLEAVKKVKEPVVEDAPAPTPAPARKPRKKAEKPVVEKSADDVEAPIKPKRVTKKKVVASPAE